MDERIVQRVVSEVLRVLAYTRADPRMGIVDGYDPGNYRAKVRIQPENVLTGWLPIHTPNMGSGWGMYFGLVPGAQVKVDHLEDDFGSGQIVGAVNDDSNPPPNVPSGEFWLIHQSGSFLKLTNDGNISLNTNADLVVTTTGKVNMTSQGDTDVTSQGKVTVTAQGDVDVTSSGNVILTGQVQLGASGGKKVALDGDPVTDGKVVASSTNTKAT